MEENLNLEKFNPTRAELLSLADEGRKLVINGIDDAEGYAAVHTYRMKLKQSRVQIAKIGKEAREEALAYQKKVIAYEKELIGIIEPIEQDLQAKQDAIDEEKARLERIALLPSRKEKLTEIGLTVDDDFLIAMDVDAFQEFYDSKKFEYIAEREAKIKADEEKLAADKNALEEAQRLDAAKKEAEKQAQEKAVRDAEIAKAKAEEDKLAAVKAEQEKAAREKQAIIDEQVQKEKAAAEEIESKKTKRLDILSELGLKFNGSEYQLGDINVHYTEIITDTDEAFAIKINKISEEIKRRLQQETLEKQKKYQKWLESHGYKDDGTFKIEKVDNVVVLYKKLGEYATR